MCAQRAKQIGKRIKALRKENHLTQDQLAAQIDIIVPPVNEKGLRQSTISGWEKGSQLPPLQKLIALSEIFQCDIAYLLCDYDKKKKDVSEVSDFIGLSEQAVSFLLKCDKTIIDYLSFAIENGYMNSVGLIASQCIDIKMKIQHYENDVLPSLTIPKNSAKKAVQEWKFDMDYTEISFKRTRVIDELERLNELYDARLLRCKRSAEASIESFIDKEVF